MRKKMLRVALWILVAAHMALIYAMSAQEAELSSKTSGQVAAVVAQVLTPGFEELPPPQQAAVIEGYQHPTRKAAHMTEYALLAALLTLALSQKGKRSPVIAMIVTVAYAALDETHQLWVDGRGAQFTDVLFDAGGALVGTVAALMLLAFIRRRRRGFTA